MDDIQFKKHFLFPSTLFVAKTPHIITTVLGSCVAVCMFDTRQRYGAMNHYMLPLWNGVGLATPKYGNIAIERTWGKLQDLGSQKRDVIVKVFGGASNLGGNQSQFNIGERNIIIGEQTLKDLRLPIKAASTGGNRGRNVKFNTHTGEVIMRYVRGK